MKILQFIFIILILILLIALFNFYPLKSYYYNYFGNVNYQENFFNEALKKYNKAQSIGNNSPENKNIILYNEANSKYKLGLFNEAIKKYNEINKPNIVLDFFKNHNLGNSYYKLGEKNNDINFKIGSWEESLKFYENALNLDTFESKEETQKNYEFVKNKLNELKNNLEKKEEERLKESNGKEDNSQEQSGNQEDSKNEDQNNTNSGSQEDSKNGESDSLSGSLNNGENTNSGNIFNKSDNFKNIGESSQNKENLSNKEMQEIEEYLNYLKILQKENYKYLQKEPDKNESFENLFNNFFGGDPFFNDIIPENNSNSRNW